MAIAKSCFLFTPSRIIKYDRRFESTGVAPRTKSCRLCTWILTCSISTCFHACLPHVVRVCTLCLLTLRNKRRAFTFSVTYFLLRLVRWIKVFSLCILSIIPSCDWFRLRTSERKQGRKEGRKNVKEKKIKLQKGRKKVEIRERSNSFSSGEFYFVVVAEESACE